MKTEIHIHVDPIAAPEPPVTGCGAVVLFDGVVRGEEDGTVIPGLDYEAYMPMAGRVIENLLTELADAHPCERVVVRHRIGRVPSGEVALRVQIHSKHRRGAFALLSAFMDRFKQDVPIWKKVVP